MADDVKVKFSGDFTDVSKGAADASKKAGTALASWSNEFTNSIKNNIIGSLALTSIIGTIVNNITNTMSKFKEIDSMSRKLGVGREDLQRFAKLGKEVNVDMETMGRSIAFANKTIGAAALGNKDAAKSLELLGYTTEQITGGNIKATDVLYKLADAYTKNKAEHGEVIAQNLLAKETTNLFGRSGSELTAIIKEGTEALKERVKQMKIYSDEEVKAGARTARFYEKGKAKLERTFGFGNFLESTGISLSIGDVERYQEEFVKEKGKGYDPTKHKKEFFDYIFKRAKSEGYDAGELALTFTAMQGGGALGLGRVTKEQSSFYESMINFARNEEEKAAKAEQAAAKNELVPIKESNLPALAASSLQQIGGGDIASVANIYRGGVEDYTRRTAEATEKLVAQDQPASKKITSVAK